jgi:hypothetical protein
MYEMDQYTVSLLHFENGIVDETGKVWTAINGATISSAQAKIGSSALYLNGTNQYLSTPNSTDFDFGSGDFTIDWWEYRETLSGNNRPVFVRDGSNTSYQAYLIGDGDYHGTDISCSFSSGTSSWNIGALSLGTAILNAWTHYAVVRKGTTFYGFQNGVLKHTLTSAASLAASNGNPAIGKYASGQNQFSGYIDEFRVSKGIARWTSDFSPSVSTPINLTATAGDSQVTLAWDTVSSATGYNVKRSTAAGGPYTTVGSNVSGTSYIDSAVVDGTTYYYVVTALNGTSESANSNEASATPEGHNLLRITMSDSSEREYEVNTTEFASFLTWFNRTIGTENSYYSFDKTVGSQSSTEYLAFEKIISFKTMTVNEQVILKIIMSDSSEREYKVSSADAFVNWHERTVSPCASGTTDYEFTDSIDGSTEYLSFEKIISFEVIPLAK